MAKTPIMDKCKSFVVILLISALCLQTASANCMLSMKLDLTYNQPLILSTVTDSWYSLDSSPVGTLQLRHDETVKLLCPSVPGTPNFFTTFPNKMELIAKCLSGNRFEVDKKSYSFDQLQCNTPVQPATLRTSQHCISPKNELIKVGYPLGNTFVSAYEVCFDKEEKGAVYVETEVSPNHVKNDAPVQESVWRNDAAITGASNVESEYTCSGQAETFYRILGKSYFSVNDKCCFAKAQLVSGKDFAYGPQQVATYHYLNSVPQWSTCNNRANWAEVERRVRQLSLNLNRPLRVWTGASRRVRLNSKWIIFTKDMYLHYASKTDKALPVPLYIWKVVHDPQTRQSLAIIQLNKPNADLDDSNSHTLCEDICHNVNWMNFLQRTDVARGYIYCCDLNNFELSFQITDSPFPKNAGRILRDETRSGSWNY